MSPTGTLLRRQEPGRPWQLYKRDEPVYGGELLVSLPGGAIDSKNGAVRLSFLSDLARLSPYPVLESAVIVHDSADKDLDFTLDRGRVDVINHDKGKEAARVRVRFRKETWDLTLTNPGTRVGLELYGRWPRGVPFTKDAKAEDEPTADLVLLVLHGDVQLRTRTNQYALHAPPGPAYFHWDSAGGPDAGPQRQEELPAWARPELASQPRAKELNAVVERLRQRLEDKSIEPALLETLNSTDPNERRIAVYGLGALDDLPHLAAALVDLKHEDMREVAVIALRHWIGRERGQDLRLYDFLVQSKKYSPNQAAIVLQLLHSFDDRDLGRPATYETLIDYLLHDKLAIRALAKWHLYRLVPAGKDIAYDPSGSPEERQRAHDNWKKLIPNGKLPPKGK